MFSTSVSPSRICSEKSVPYEAATEAQVWKENAGLLYGFVAVRNLEWPALSLDWTPHTKEFSETRETAQTILVGTHAAKPTKNYINVFDIKFPNPLFIEAENREFKNQNDFAGFTYRNSSIDPKFKIEKQIPHPTGEIHRIRHCLEPGSSLAAAVSTNGSVRVVDYDPNSPSGTKAILAAHEMDCWGLAWSPVNYHKMATASDAGDVCVWDMQSLDRGREFRSSMTGRSLIESESQLKRRRTLSGSQSMIQPVEVDALPTLIPLTRYDKVISSKSIQAIEWHHEIAHMFLTVGDDGDMFLWDDRLPNNITQAATKIAKVGSAINSISINRHVTYLVATGGIDKEVQLWDIRKPFNSLHRMTGHTAQINSVHFSPQSNALLVSSSLDRRAIVWDLKRIGSEQTVEEAEDGPAELLFSHGGHPAPVQEAQWNPVDESALVIASSCDQNQLHIWQMDAVMFNKDPKEDDDDVDNDDVE